MANTFKVLVGLVNQVESLSGLVVLLAKTHVEDTETITSLVAEAETVKQQAADAIKQAQNAEVKALEAQKEADEIISQDVQEEDLATRFSQAVSGLIEVAKNALPPEENTIPEVDRTTGVNVAEPVTNA